MPKGLSGYSRRENVVDVDEKWFGTLAGVRKDSNSSLGKLADNKQQETSNLTKIARGSVYQTGLPSFFIKGNILPCIDVEEPSNKIDRMTAEGLSSSSTEKLQYTNGFVLRSQTSIEKNEEQGVRMKWICSNKSTRDLSSLKNYPSEALVDMIEIIAYSIKTKTWETISKKGLIKLPFGELSIPNYIQVYNISQQKSISFRQRISSSDSDIFKITESKKDNKVKRYLEVRGENSYIKLEDNNETNFTGAPSKTHSMDSKIENVLCRNKLKEPCLRIEINSTGDGINLKNSSGTIKDTKQRSTNKSINKNVSRTIENRSKSPRKHIEDIKYKRAPDHKTSTEDETLEYDYIIVEDSGKWKEVVKTCMPSKNFPKNDSKMTTFSNSSRKNSENEVYNYESRVRGQTSIVYTSRMERHRKSAPVEEAYKNQHTENMLPRQNNSADLYINQEQRDKRRPRSVTRVEKRVETKSLSNIKLYV